jgi:UDP-4-amino-4,6-dideoxy-N-acetyl-beta-L-altrosamine transaminase
MLAYGRQLIEQDDIDEVVRVLKGDFLTTGPEIDALENAFCTALGAKHAVTCSNGTAALHLVALAMGLKEGDQVIVPSISFVATANAPVYCGAEVVFADVDPLTGLMTPENLEAAIKRCDTSRLKAIFPVHMGGHTVDLPSMKAIADRLSVMLAEDASHALGSEYQTKSGERCMVGDCSHSHFATTSLHPVKTITCGEGGVVFTANDGLAKQLKLKRSHGLSRTEADWTNIPLAFDTKTHQANAWYYELEEPGYNYRLTDFQAALARSQLAKLPVFAQKRKDLVAQYRLMVGTGTDKFKLVAASPNTDPVLHLMVALIDFAAVGKTRNQVMAELRQHGVGTQVHYIPIHRQPYYAKQINSVELSGADQYYDKCLSLPLHPSMSSGDVEKVVVALREVLG